MNQDFRDAILRGIKKYEAEGVVCRKMTDTELLDYNKCHNVEHIKVKQIPFHKRLEQVLEVQRIAKEENLRIIDACDKVGISFPNYRSVKAAHQKGLKKRP